MAAPDAKIAETLTCHHCGERIGLEMTTKLMNESRVSFVMTPHPGEFLQAKTVGGSIAEIAKILTTEDADLGVTTTVVVEGVSSNEGEMTVRFLLCRHKPEIGNR